MREQNVLLGNRFISPCFSNPITYATRPIISIGETSQIPLAEPK